MYTWNTPKEWNPIYEWVMGSTWTNPDKLKLYLGHQCGVHEYIIPTDSPYKVILSRAEAVLKYSWMYGELGGDTIPSYFMVSLLKWRCFWSLATFGRLNSGWPPPRLIFIGEYGYRGAHDRASTTRSHPRAKERARARERARESILAFLRRIWSR